MKKVVVLMSAYNGQEYIKEQLDSLISQKGVEISIIVRDDGSTDNTKSILNRYAVNYPNITVIEGRNCGAAISFWKLIHKAAEADYYSFCDQDDIWMPDKLISAITELERFPKSEPSLYYSQTKFIDGNGEAIKLPITDYQKTVPTFGQLVAENNAIGCTMVWNNSLNRIAKTFNPHYIRMHDHLLFLICQFCSGNVVNDNTSYMYYRQHNHNVIGGNNNIKKYLRSIWKFIREDSGLARQALQLRKLSCDNTVVENMLFIEKLYQYKHNRYNIKNCIAVIKKVKQKSIVKNIMIAGLVFLRRF